MDGNLETLARDGDRTSSSFTKFISKIDPRQEIEITLLPLDDNGLVLTTGGHGTFVATGPL